MTLTNPVNPAQLAFLFAGFGFGLSMLLSSNQAPQPSVYNELASIAFFGLLSAGTGSMVSVSPIVALRASWTISVPLILVGTTVLVAGLSGGLPVGLTFSSIGTLAVAILLVTTGAVFRRSADSLAILRSILLAFLIVGFLSAAIAFMQTFHPSTTDGGLIAMSHDAGRAVGNLRQPNQLASQLLWTVAAAIVWLERRPRWRVIVVPIIAALIIAGALTASRTGMIGVALLVVWGLLNKRLSRPSRLVLMASPSFYVVGVVAQRLWGVIGSQPMMRLAMQGDATTHRLELWKEAGSLILQNPWTGVGFGQFNFAWTLTRFSNRPAEFFDNAHDLILQLAVEIGIPLMLVIVACIAMSTWKVVSQLQLQSASVELAAVAFMLAIILFHSLLEFPLWYPHFLIPACFLAGWAVANDGGPDAPRRRRRRWTTIPGLICAVLAGVALLDYQRVAGLYSKDNSVIPVTGRLIIASQSLLFSYHADYAMATLAQQPSLTAQEIGRVSHVILGPRLMLAWVKALQEQNDTERARYLVERVREFHGAPDNQLADDFLATCDAAPKTADNPCLPSTKPLTWRDFQDYPLH